MLTLDERSRSNDTAHDQKSIAYGGGVTSPDPVLPDVFSEPHSFVLSATLNREVTDDPVQVLIAQPAILIEIRSRTTKLLL